MESKLLSKEELKVLQDKYEYDISYIMHAHKEKSRNAEISVSFFEEMDFVNEDIFKKYEYTPRVNHKVEMKPLNIPEVELKTDYVPLTDANVEIKYEADIQSLVDVKNSVNYTPVNDVKVDIGVKEVPNAEFKTKYKPKKIKRIKMPKQKMPKTTNIQTYSAITVKGVVMQGIDVPEIADP